MLPVMVKLTSHTQSQILRLATPRSSQPTVYDKGFWGLFNTYHSTLDLQIHSSFKCVLEHIVQSIDMIQENMCINHNVFITFCPLLDIVCPILQLAL